MKTPLHVPDTPKSCWSETISDLNNHSRETVNQSIRELSGTLRLLMARLSEYQENGTSGFKLLNNLDLAKSYITKLSEKLKAAHKGIKEAKTK